MRSIETLVLAVGLLVFSASSNPPRAEDIYTPAEGEAPPMQTPGARWPVIATIGEVHTNVIGKPCLEYNPSSRGHLFDTHMFDYVVAVTNKCGRLIKVQICQKDRSGCGTAAVHAYRSTDMVMGFGPYMADFHYVARETP